MTPNTISLTWILHDVNNQMPYQVDFSTEVLSAICDVIYGIWRLFVALISTN